MADVRTSRRRVPVVLALAAGAGALVVVGYLASIFIREELAIAALRSPEETTRAAAAATLGEMGTVRAIPALLDCERPAEELDDVSRVAYGRGPAYAFAALDRIVSRGAAAALVRLAGDPGAANRLWAITQLGRIDQRGDESFQALTAALEDKHFDLVSAAAASLVRFGRRATPFLVATLLHADRWENQSEAVEEAMRQALMELGPLAWPAVESLAPRTLKDPPSCGEIRRLEYLDAGYWACVGDELGRRLENASRDTEEELATALSSLSLVSGDLFHAAELAPVLERLLEHPHPKLRDAALYALRWATGTTTEKMLRVALDLLREGEPVWTVSGWPFRAAAPTRVEALRPLLRPLREADADRYELFLYTLAQSAEHYPAALELLEELGVGADAVAKPQEPAHPAKSLIDWLDRVRGDDLDAHREAIQHLRELTPATVDLPLLERSLADPDAAVRAVAAHLTGKLGPAASRTTAALEACLRLESPTIRLHAALALCQVGSARAALEDVFREAVAVNRTAALGAEGLLCLRLHDETRLRELLYETAPIDCAALKLGALGRMGSTAASAVPLLRELVRDAEGLATAAQAGAFGDARGQTREVSFYIGPAPYASVLRGCSMEALTSVAPTAATAELLARHLLDPDDNVSEAAARGLLQLAPHAAGTIPLLVSCLRRSHRALHASVILSRIGAPAVPALLEALDDADADLRTWAAWTLGGMGAGAADAVAALERRLRDADELVRAAAAHALGLIGQPAERSLASLEELTKDSSSLVHRQTVTAIRRLRDPAAWRPERRELPPADDLECGNATEDEQERFHLSLCDRHAPP